MTILIVTPTGNIGSLVLHHVLAQSQTPIRVLVRDATKLLPSVQGKVEVVEGSIDNMETVDKACTGVTTVFHCVPPNMQASDVIQHYERLTQPLCQAVQRQGIKRVVAVSTGGRAYSKYAGLLSAAFCMEEMIEQTGVHFRALRCGPFMDNVRSQIYNIKQGKYIQMQSAELKLPAVSVRDIATIAARLMLDDSWTGQAGVTMYGPEDLSHSDMAQTMTEVLGQPVEFIEVPEASFRSTMLQYGASVAHVDGMVAMFDAATDGVYTLEQRMPECPCETTFRQWCEDVLKPAVFDAEDSK